MIGCFLYEARTEPVFVLVQEFCSADKLIKVCALQAPVGLF